jgi:hypothetical protein
MRGAQAAFDDVVAGDQPRGFKLRSLRTEIRQTGGAAEIERALAGIREVAFFHDHIARPAFELDAGAGGEAFLADETAAGDERMVAAHEVDALPAPAGDRAVADGELVEAGALDAVVIAARADVTDLDVVERDAGDGIREITAVVEVQPIAGLAADAQVSQREAGTT